ncbi:MAG: citrate synthase [Leptospiraceae bacterium]|nr:citrate synthase [Leptospiraceae bacterium]MDW7975315.1 citrate/2-methylcitrate synthase [Leptospiraceae bacterium]
MDYAEIKINGKFIRLPLIKGSDGKQAIDIRFFNQENNITTFDTALNSTSIAKSQISYIDSKNGKLYYRGYDVEELVEKSTFVEVAFLLIYGHLPTKEEMKKFSLELSKHSMIHESMRLFFDAFPGTAHPLAILATLVTALSAYYPLSFEENMKKGIDIRIRLLAKVRTLAAWAYKKSVGQPIIYPRDELPYCTNFLNMMFATPAEPYQVDPIDDRILNQVLILYADHEMNATTTTVRIVASGRANLFACINAGICSLWGSRESDANVPPIVMLEEMINKNLTPEVYFRDFLYGKRQLKLNSLGHPAYETEDPRARVSRRLFKDYYQLKLQKDPTIANDPIIKKALEVEDYVSNHPLFKEMNLYLNVEFYSALIFKLLGIPPKMNNVIRTIGKLPGWLAHWSEQREDPDRKSYRPRQVYVGNLNKKYIPIDERT